MEPPVTDYFHSVLFIHSFRSRIHFVGQRREEKTHETYVLRPADLCSGEDFRTNEILGGAGEGSLGVFFGDDGESGQGEWTSQTSRDRPSPLSRISRARARAHAHVHTNLKTAAWGAGLRSLGRRWDQQRGSGWGYKGSGNSQEVKLLMNKRNQAPPTP